MTADDVDDAVQIEEDKEKEIHFVRFS